MLWQWSSQVHLAYKTERIHSLVTYTVLASLNTQKESAASAWSTKLSTKPASSLLRESGFPSCLSMLRLCFLYTVCPWSSFSLVFENKSWSFGFRVYREPDSVTLGVVTELQHAFSSREQRTCLWVIGVTPFTISPQGQLTWGSF